MSFVAVLTWFLTALAGIYLVAIWLIEYDPEYQSAAATRLPIWVILTHALLAITGLAVWVVYIFSDNERLAWAAVVILGVVATLGLTMAVRWIGVMRNRAYPREARMIPPERHFPVTIVVAHGVLAVGTITLVLLTALNVGGS